MQNEACQLALSAQVLIKIAEIKRKKVENIAPFSFFVGRHTLDARLQNPPLGGFKHVECLCGTPGIVSLLKTWFFQLCMIASTLFWSNSMDTFNGLIVLRIHF